MRIINENNLTKYDDLSKVKASTYIPDALKNQKKEETTKPAANGKKLGNRTIHDITAENNGKVVTIGGIITAVRTILTKKGDKKSKNKKQPESEKPQPSPQPQTAAAAFADVDDDSLIEMPRNNLPSLKLDPTAYSSLNLSEILFGEGGGRKNEKKKKKK